MVLSGWVRADPTLRSGGGRSATWKVQAIKDLEASAVRSRAGIWEDYKPAEICMPATQRKNGKSKPWEEEETATGIE
jgi:hypothetical protein